MIQKKKDRNKEIYEDRVLIFLDILGFKDKIDSTINEKGVESTCNINKILKAYEIVINDLDINGSKKTNDFEFPSKKISIFSDCVAISFLANEKTTLYFTLQSVKTMILHLIQNKVLCRGAITCGKLYHKEDIIFGPALVEAHTLESRAALYPRVIMSNEIINIGSLAHGIYYSAQGEKDEILSLLEKDTDGMYYIDYFSVFHEYVDNIEFLENYIRHMNTLFKLITEGLSKSKFYKKSDIRVKYLWMKERYNKYVDYCKSENWVVKLRNAGGISRLNLFHSLKKVKEN